MAVALGLRSSTGMALPRFLAGKVIALYVGAELREKLGKPLIFQGSGAVLKSPPMVVHGHDATPFASTRTASVCAGALHY